MEFRVLGPVEAFRGSTAVELGGRAQRALLALLLLDPGRPVAAGRLVDELWPEGAPPGAATTLRSYVSRLRRTLGADAVEGGRGSYALRAEREDVDAWRFEQLVREGRDALERGSPGLASERLTAALALWRGEALADVADDGALARERLRLEELKLVCLEHRIEADLALGRHTPLVPELQTLVREQPLREGLRRQLVLALYRSGRQSEALDACREARRVLVDELGLEPGAELKAVERAILRHEVEQVAPAGGAHNLPGAATSFVGRARELGELEQLLRLHRLVTVTGMGGAGKTRLATEAARRQVDAWAGGVWLADLTALADPSLVPAAVAAAAGVRDPATLVDELRTRELLLVLDNCEHVVDACAELTTELLRCAPDVRILATSRVPLGVAGEAELSLDPLDREAAVRLFLDRAAAVRRDLPDDEATRRSVDDICSELDDLPLAIELAAARAKALSPAEIATRLDDRLRFLRAWRRVADPRHRTLETTMDWSYDLLAPEEQQLLRRLGVFAGGMTLDAIAAVCAEDEALDVVTRLVDASLVRVAPGQPTRYALLETVRQYAAAKLAADPDAAAVHRAHAQHFLRLADSANLSIDTLGRGEQRLDVVLREQHNIRAALDWLADADPETALRLMVTVENFWVTQALAEGIRRYEQLFPRAPGADLTLLAAATRDYGAFLDVLERLDDALAAYERSRALFAEAGDELGVASLDFRLGIVAHLSGDRDRARELWEQSLETFTRRGYAIGRIQALGNLGGYELDHGDFARGRAMVDEALELARAAGWQWWQARSWGDLAERLLLRGDVEEAEEYGRRYLAYAWQTANRQETLLGLAILARAAAARGAAERALALWASVEAVEAGPGRFGRFDRAEYARAMPAGPRPEPLPLDDAVALALK